MRIVSKIILLFFMIINMKCFSGEPSFFMTPEESDSILKMKSGRNLESEKGSANTELKISGIFYIDNNNWTVWINNLAYSSIGQQVGFSIDEVFEDGAVLTLDDGTTLNLSVNSSIEIPKISEKKL